MPAKNREVSPYSREEAERRLDEAAARKRQGSVPDRVSRSKRSVRSAVAAPPPEGGGHPYVIQPIPMEYALLAARERRRGVDVSLFAAGTSSGGDLVGFNLEVVGESVSLVGEQELIPSADLARLGGSAESRRVPGPGTFSEVWRRAVLFEALAGVDGIETQLRDDNRVSFKMPLGDVRNLDAGRMQSDITAAFRDAGFRVDPYRE